MKRTIPYWQIAGFIFTSILGTFLHFLFDLTNGSIAAAFTLLMFNPPRIQFFQDLVTGTYGFLGE